jgi:hypothetical protein
MNESFGFESLQITDGNELYKASEQQDSLIAKAISLLSFKFIEILYAMREHTKELTLMEKLPSLYTLVNKKWKTEFLDLYH